MNRFVLLLVFGALSTLPNSPTMAQVESENDRIERNRNFPAWQKEAVDRARLQKLIKSLQSKNPQDQDKALEQLALAKPIPKFRDPVFETAKRVHAQRATRWTRAMPAHINGAWSEAEQAEQLLRTASKSGGMKYLQRMLDQGNRLQVNQAMIAIGYSGDPQAATILIDNVQKNRIFAVKALELIGPEAAPTAIVLLESPDELVRKSGLELMGKIGTKNEIPALNKFVEHCSPQLRSAASKAVKAIQDRERNTAKSSGQASGKKRGK